MPQSWTSLKQQVTDSYGNSTDIRYAAARLWVDGIITPAATRNTLINALKIATRNTSETPFTTGVLQV